MNHVANRFTVVFDACVFFSAPLRDLLMWLAVEDLFRAKWTESIHDEWIEALLRDRPDLSREKLARTRQLMDEHVRDCLVTGYEELIDSLTLPDPDDRHVLAAAIVCSADAIVTFNLKDFPEEQIGRYGIEAIHPDDFVMSQFSLAAPVVLRAAKKQRESLRNPPRSVDEFLAALERSQLVQTVAELRRYREFI